MKILAIVVLVFLAGCTRAQDAATLAEERTKQAKDIEAGVLEDAPCLIGLGAWGRMTDPRKRHGIFYTCVPDAERYGVGLTAP